MKKTLITLIVLMISVSAFSTEEVETECQKMVEGRDAGKGVEVQETTRTGGQSAIRQ